MNKVYSQPGAWAVIYRSATSKFLMGKRSAKVNTAGTWNLFGGRIDTGESPRKALLRELCEEAGIRIKSKHITKLITVSRKFRSSQFERDMHYSAIRTDNEFCPRLNREHNAFRWFTAKQPASKFTGPASIAIKKGLLEKTTRH